MGAAVLMGRGQLHGPERRAAVLRGGEGSAVLIWGGQLLLRGEGKGQLRGRIRGQSPHSGEGP